jgi:aminoglycoside 3-N-acetyltransferase I
MEVNKPKITIKKLAGQDIDEFVELIELFAEVFAMENFTLPNRVYLREVLSKPAFIAMVALDGQRVVGGLTAYVLEQYYSVKPLAYLYDLGVEAARQRRGIGRQLIAALRKYCQEQGFEELFVQADLEDEHASEFYRATLAAGEKEVRQFYRTFD